MWKIRIEVEIMRLSSTQPDIRQQIVGQIKMAS